MTQIKWPTLRATTEVHSVEVRGARLAGMLVRDSASRIELGYVWAAGSRWGWRAPDGEHYGERATLAAALEVLRDTFDFLNRVSPLAHATLRQRRALSRMDDDDTSAPAPKTARETEQKTKTAPAPVVVVKPAHVQQIVWGPAGGDLRAAVARALDAEKGGK